VKNTASDESNAPLKISKRVPAVTVTLKARWCKPDFMEMSPLFRKIRAEMNSPISSCYWCSGNLVDGEMMALACFVKIGNKILCQECAKELLASLGSKRKKSR
jgi:hypothetical protein